MFIAACASPERDGGFDVGGVSGSGAGDSEGSGDGSASGGTSGPGSGSGDSQTSGGPGPDSGDGDGDGDGDSGGVRFDVGSGMSGGSEGGVGDGCAKIDFLFAIDNSGSMLDNQENLTRNFGPFIDTIVSNVDAQDYQIMVVDSDSCSTEGCTPSSCEDFLGAGQVRGCPVPGGRRYLTSDLDRATLESTFACVASVGDQGSSRELPFSAMAEAVTTQAGPGACNEGFVRDDAVLVVTIITDDDRSWGDDDDSWLVGSPQQWYDAVVSAKLGVAQNIVVLGLIGTEDAGFADGGCFWDSPPRTSRFREFVDLFGERGLQGNVCEEDYNSFFAEAVGLIDTACDDFVPPG